MKYSVTADNLYVRCRPSPAGYALSLIPFGHEIEVDSVTNGWAAFGLFNDEVRIATVYSSAAWLAPVVTPPPPPPTPSTDVLLGFHCLSNGRAAQNAFAAGARFIMLMDDKAVPSQLRGQGCKGMWRRYFTYPPSVEGMAQDCSSLPDGWIGTGVNENEYVNFNIQQHADFDIAVARRLRQLNPGVFFAGGTYSVGTPDFTNPQVCADIKQYYAPAYNSGLLWFDYHCYSPSLGHIYKSDDLIWYERRWEFLFTRCGFDPTIRHIVAGECGLAQGSAGGYASLDTPDEKVVAELRQWKVVQSAPLVVDGKSYPSPFYAGALFQLGDISTENGHWGGFAHDRYLAAISAAKVF